MNEKLKTFFDKEKDVDDLPEDEMSINDAIDMINERIEQKKNRIN